MESDFTVTRKRIPRRQEPGRKMKYPWNSLEVGQRFFTRNNVTRAAAYQSKNGREFSCVFPAGIQGQWLLCVRVAVCVLVRAPCVCVYCCVSIAVDIDSS